MSQPWENIQPFEIRTEFPRPRLVQQKIFITGLWIKGRPFVYFPSERFAAQCPNLKM